MRRVARRVSLCHASFTCAFAAVLFASPSGCGGGDEATRPVASPTTARPRPVAPSEPSTPRAPADDEPDVSLAHRELDDASAPPPARPPLPEPSFGATEPARPGDPHAFRAAAALRAMRSNRSGARVLKMLSVMPHVIAAKAQTEIDPFSDGEWLLVYGSKVEIPGPNANVLGYARPEAQVANAIADAGMEPSDAGVGAAHSELFGVRDVLLRPQPKVIALVPGDRAHDLAVALAKPVEPGVKPGELARIFVAEPAKLARFLPAEVVRANVIVKAAADGGLDASAEADCPDAAFCKATAAAIEELAKRQNSIMVRIVLKNLLGNLAVRADGTKLKATLHAEPGQVDAVLNITRVQLGLPAADP